jgi:hypothetical protein
MACISPKCGMPKPPRTVHTGWPEKDFPMPIRETRIVPMPKRLCASGGTVRALGSGILTDLDVSTFALRKQARNLPVIHKLFLDAELNSLGYTQQQAKRNPSELHFIDPELKLLRTVRLPDACSGFTPRGGEWIVSCRDGGLHCFDRSGNVVWTWKAPRHRHSQSPVFLVAANQAGTFAAEGLYLYALASQGALRWEWELPNHNEQTRRLSILIGRDSSSQALALQTLGLKSAPTPEEIRQAHRRMARLTHPDLNPDDNMASARFRSVQQAFECLQKTSPAAGQAATITIGLEIGSRPTTRITALTVQESAVGIGTSRGEVYLCDHAGKVQACHLQLGRQAVSSVILRHGHLDAAFCYPRLYRFGGGSPVASEDIEEYFVDTVPHGDDVLVCGWKTMWLFGRDAQLKGRMRFERKIDGVAACGCETLVLSGSLIAIPYC